MYGSGQHFWGKNCAYNNQDNLISISAGNDLRIHKINFTGENAVIAQDTAIPRLEPFAYPVTACAISTDGNNLLVATNQGLQIFSFSTNEFKELPAENFHGASVSECSYFPEDNNLCVTASLDKTVKIWDIENSRCMQTISAANSICCLALKEDGKTIVAGTTTGDIYIWQQTGDDWSTLPGVRLPYNKHQGEVKCCVFSPDGSKMVSTGADQTLAIWDTRSWSVQYLAQDTTTINCCVFADDGQILYLGGNDSSIKYINLTNLQALTAIRIGQHANRAAITDCFFSNKHRVIISRSRVNNEIKMFPKIDLTRAQPLSALNSYQLTALPPQRQSQPASPQNTPLHISRLNVSRSVNALLDLPLRPSQATISSGVGTLSRAGSSSEMDTATFINSHYNSPASFTYTASVTDAAADILPQLGLAAGSHSPDPRINASLQLPAAAAVTPLPAAARSLPSPIKLVSPNSSPLRHAAATAVAANAVPLGTPALSSKRRLSFADPGNYIRQITHPTSQMIGEIVDESTNITQNRMFYQQYLIQGRGARRGLLEQSIMSALEEIRTEKITTLAAQISIKKQISEAHDRSTVSCSAIGLCSIKSFFFGKITNIYIIVSGGDTEVRRWNLEPKNKKPVKKMTGHQTIVTCCGISDDGTYIFSTDNGGGIRIRPSRGLNAWGMFTALYIAPKPVKYALMTKDNKYLLYSMTTSNENEEYPLEFLDRENMQKIFSITGHTDTITGMIWLTETVLVTSSLDNTIRLWDLKPKNAGSEFHPVDGSINPQLMKTLTLKFPIFKFSTIYADVDNSGRKEIQNELERRILVYACFPEDSKTLYLVTEKDREAGISILKTLVSDHSFTACCFSNNGYLLVTGHENGNITIWEVKTGLKLTSKREHTAAVQSISFSKDSSLMISTSTDGQVIIWDTLIKTLADTVLGAQQDFEN
jgi:WD40 repeat protein